VNIALSVLQGEGGMK